VSNDHAPILIGAGQLTQRDVEAAEALEPVAMMGQSPGAPPPTRVSARPCSPGSTRWRW
jgi:hypothetical protein